MDQEILVSRQDQFKEMAYMALLGGRDGTIFGRLNNGVRILGG